MRRHQTLFAFALGRPRTFALAFALALGLFDRWHCSSRSMLGIHTVSVN
jgi:hypothetical protein